MGGLGSLRGQCRAARGWCGPAAEAWPTPCPACPPRHSRPRPGPAARPSRPTHSAVAEQPHACDLGGVSDGKEIAGAGDGSNSLPRSLRDLRSAPREGAS